MFGKSYLALTAGAVVLALTSVTTAQERRVSSTQKGSILYFSKIEIKWGADGNLIQDTFVDITNDYPADVEVQGYFINGDVELEEICSGEPCKENIIRDFEPGWNTADCKFTLTGNQPHFWSAATGSNKCQPFTVLDEDGPGRPDPGTDNTTRILRGFAVFFAVDFFSSPNPGPLWLPIRWNHLKGDAVLVNYADGAAWEYNAWAFQVHNGCNGCPFDEPGEPCAMTGTEIDAPFQSLLLDFYASGSTALSGGGRTVTVDTDLTVHAVSLDLRQDGCGPVLTKVEAEIWNEFETKFSGTRRCICCWDQTMLSNWSRTAAIPNHFKRSALRTDKGKARLTGVASDECDYLELCGPTATRKRWSSECGDSVAGGNQTSFHGGSEDAALLGLATKFLTYSPNGDMATAGMNLTGTGAGVAVLLVDGMVGPEELRGSEQSTGTRDSGQKARLPGRNSASRDDEENQGD